MPLYWRPDTPLWRLSNSRSRGWRQFLDRIGDRRALVVSDADYQPRVVQPATLAHMREQANC